MESNVFFEAIPGVLGRSVNFSITKISIKTARVSRLSVSYDYGHTYILANYFLGLTCRLGTRMSSIFQPLAFHHRRNTRMNMNKSFNAR